MKKIILSIFFATFFCAAYSQELTSLKEYGLPFAIDTKGLEITEVDSSAKSPDAKKVIQLEFDQFIKLYILCLKPGKLANKMLLTTIADLKKQKNVKIISQEKNALMVATTSTSVYRIFYAASLNGNQYFFQSGSVSEEKAKKLMEIVKSVKAN